VSDHSRCLPVSPLEVRAGNRIILYTHNEAGDGSFGHSIKACHFSGRVLVRLKWKCH